MQQTSVTIGGASGYWGEAAHATQQLLASEKLDFLAYDYLAEITMSIMGRARAKDPTKGYATDFITAAMAPNLEEIARQNVRVLSNAGGVNPQACGAALRELIKQQSLNLTVAVITGDDLLESANHLSHHTEMFTGSDFPDPNSIASINAYLGAFPIAMALDKGADIVITGRCVDSAVSLGACIHAFGWKPSDCDLLSAGSLAGHIIECGPQATGGNFTDWRDAGSIAEIGYPIAEISKNGGITISKPKGTSGIVSPLTVGEQMLYEIGDPGTYELPDVICDFSDVTVTQEAENLVSIIGAKGRAPSGKYKVCATYLDGFRAGQTFAFNGFEARAKAESLGQAIFERARTKFRAHNVADFDETSIEVFGGTAGDKFKASSGYEECLLKVAARHRDAKAIGTFLKEMAGTGLATPPGMSLFTAGGRPTPSPVVRLFSFLIDRKEIQVQLDLAQDGNGAVPFSLELGALPLAPSLQPQAQEPETVSLTESDLVQVPLVKLAVGRSGDKGNKANIGIMAREAKYLPYIWASLSSEVVAELFSHWLEGQVHRYYLPGCHSINFVLDDVLGGGGIASLRQDSQGKGYAQILLAAPVSLPRLWANEAGLEGIA